MMLCFYRFSPLLESCKGVRKKVFSKAMNLFFLFHDEYSFVKKTGLRISKEVCFVSDLNKTVFCGFGKEDFDV